MTDTQGVVSAATAASAANHVVIFDTTLRDGEQSPGCSMTIDEKLRIAHLLEEMGVDVIEAGFPIASNGDFQAVHQIAGRVTGAVVAGLARAHAADIERCAEAVAPAKRPRIHTFISTSDVHLKYQLKMTREQVLEAIDASVSLARKYCPDVEWSAMDATRSDRDFLCQAVSTAIRAGARTINIPDTVGFAVPDEMAEIIRLLIVTVPGAADVVFSVHCHNDLGLATANALAGVVAGARQIECTINGIGERAGNAALEEVVMALKVRSDRIPYYSSVRSELITRASRLLSSTVGFSVQPNKAIVGANAFAHESGIHQDGVLKHAETYEIMRPESVGLVNSELVLGKHSGRNAFRSKLKDLGYELGDNALNDMFQRFKNLADRKKEIFDDDIIALVTDEMGHSSSRLRFVSLGVMAGSRGPQSATLELEIDGETRLTSQLGNGPVDAVFNAIKSLVAHDAELRLYQVQAVTGGTDAQAEVLVRLEGGGKTVNGQGIDADTLVASAKAYLQALDKLLARNEKITPMAPMA